MKEKTEKVAIIDNDELKKLTQEQQAKIAREKSAKVSYTKRIDNLAENQKVMKFLISISLIVTSMILLVLFSIENKGIAEILASGGSFFVLVFMVLVNVYFGPENSITRQVNKIGDKIINNTIRRKL